MSEKMPLSNIRSHFQIATDVTAELGIFGHFHDEKMGHMLANLVERAVCGHLYFASVSTIFVFEYENGNT